MYRYFIRPILFLFPPESVHHFVFSIIRTISFIPGVNAIIRACYSVNDKRLERNLFGIVFPNPVGLAAGFDKDAKAFRELGNFGFGSIEIGTLTPKSQTGNDKPRMFRLLSDQAIINRMGFNNKGVDAAVKRLKNRKGKLIIGGNIGKNKSTSNEEAINDYVKCFNILFDHVDYFVVNVSSPNTPNLRALQEKEPLSFILSKLKKLNSLKEDPKPILLKIAPDLSNDELDDIIDIVRTTQIDGIIATNTTVTREGLHTNKEKITAAGTGGLSGLPLKKRALEVVNYLHTRSAGAFPIIGVGGIHTAQDALDMIHAGASLVQIYTGFIYEGPGLVKRINKALIK